MNEYMKEWFMNALTIEIFEARVIFFICASKYGPQTGSLPSFGSELELQIFRIFPRPTESKTLSIGGKQNSYFIKSFKVILKHSKI